ncbi:restriction endonuclease [Hydrogenophaga pseudoflava]|uniref:restriction endonuclease n=1 Tax=Hydrogenophaga pseudoflava TaxID=47421 RepID=UPI0027E535C6|nr:restriction endonuclease [Hydrogenophaga pseudoflava]MDQ7743848.1 restriction endonuclease [Hydrogenophaga pseudoflava]
MPVPTYDQFIEPILRYLALHPQGSTAPAAHEAAAKQLGLTDEEKALILPSGVQRVYKNRAGWAHDRLKRAGLSSSPKHGFWKLTAAGIEFAKSNPAPLSDVAVQKLASEYLGVTLKPSGASGLPPAKPALVAIDHKTPTAATPDDQLDWAMAALRQSASDDLLERLASVSPSFFENLVLDVLHRMGYGASRDDLVQTGGPGDGGVDGVINLDRLGLEKVYVQAKRWQQSIGRPDIQAFYGALAGQKAKKGIFITTSTFTPQACEFAKSVEGIVLIDGARLTNLMIEYEVGISSRTIRIPKVDSDYFDEDAT